MLQIMATPSETSSSSSQSPGAPPNSSKHLWVCDSIGGVHVLAHVTSQGNTNKMLWREVSGKMDRIVCGTSGSTPIVCGIKNNQMYLRTGISSSKPLGLKWALARAEAVEVAIGTNYLVTKNSSNELLALRMAKFADKLSQSCSEIVLTGWEAIEKKSFLSLLVMDSTDTLYGFSPKGDVYTCGNLNEDNRMISWGNGKVKGHPGSSFSLGSFVSWFSKSSTNMFQVSAVGSGCVWCLQKSPLVLWQLVLPPPSHSGSDRWKWLNWEKFTFSDGMALSRLCGDPDSNNELFAISEENDTVYRLTLSSSTVQIHDLPFHGCGDITLSSLSLSTVGDPSTPSIYPKVPIDICCENGDCSFCQSQSNSPTSYEMRMYLKRGREEGSSRAKHSKLYIPEPSGPTGNNNNLIVGKKRSSTIRLDVDEQFQTCLTTVPPAVKRRKTGTAI